MEDDGNVINFRPRGSAPPGLPPLPVGPPPAPPSAPPPAAPPDGGAPAVPARSRRSAAESLAALTPAPPPVPAPAAAPVALRAEGTAGDDSQEPSLGALSMSAVLAIALAALRGTVTVWEDWREQRVAREEERAPLRQAKLKRQLAAEDARAQHELAMQGIADKRAQQRARVPSGHEYGRQTLQRLTGGSGSRPGSTGTAGGGPARSSKSTAPATSTSSSPGSSKTPATRSGGSSAPGPARTPSSASSTSPSSKTPAPAGKGAQEGQGPKGKASLPGALGQVAVERAKARSARQAAQDQRAARQQEADLADRKAARKRAAKDTDGRAGGESALATSSKAEKDGRTTLGQAIAEDVMSRASRRMEDRRENPDPPFLSKIPKEKADGRDDAEGEASDDGPKVDLTKEPEAGTEEAGADKPSSEDSGPSAAGAAADPGDAEGSTSSTDRDTPRKERDGAEDSASKDDEAPGSDWAWWVPPPRGERRSAAESMGEATKDEVVITVERADNVSTSTITKEARVSAPIPIPSGVAAEHMTEVTLDDVLDALSEAKDECLTTYDECAVLADKALKLRQSFTGLAIELRERHNVIGRLTSAAMARLAESMDLVARTAEQMRIESLKAAESVETAHDAMHDAYRPVQQAAVNAGLSMPSARIHNEE